MARSVWRESWRRAPDVANALTQEGADGPLLRGIDVGRRNEIGPQQMGQFLRIDAVILGFAAVNGLEIKGMGQDEGEAGLVAGIGQPVPAEHAFAADGEAVAVGLNAPEEELEIVALDVGVDEDLALAIHDADV